MFKKLTLLFHNNSILAYTAFGMVFLQGTNFITGILLARYLPTADFGKFQLLVSLITSTAIVTKIGMDEGFVYFLPKVRKLGFSERLFSFYSLAIALVLSLFVGLLIYSTSELIDHTLLKNIEFHYELKIFVVYLSSFVFFTMTGAILRGLELFNFRAFLVYYLNPLLFLLFIGYFIFISRDLTVYKVYSYRILVFFIVGLIGLIYLFLLSTPFKSIGILKKDLIKSYHYFSISLIFLTLIEFLAEQPTIDLLILANYDSAENVGIYAANYRIAIILLIPYLAFQVIYASKFSKLFTEGKLNELKKNYLSTKKKMMIISISVLIVINLLYDYIILLFGANYAEGKYAFILLSVGFTFFSMSGLNNLMLIVNNRKKILAMLDFLLVLFLMFLGILFVGFLSITGMALANSVLFVVFTVIKKSIIKEKYL